MVYIYGLYCPDSHAIRYIGKSVNPKARLQRHLSSAANGNLKHHAANWIRGLLSRGLKPRLVHLEAVDESDWQDAEKRWIAFALSSGWPLTNSTLGGEGLNLRLAEGREAYSQKMSQIMKSLYQDSPEMRKLARDRARKLWSDPRLASNQRTVLASQQVREKMSSSAKKAGNDPVKAARRLNTMRSAQHRSLRSDIAKATNCYPGVKDAISKAVKSHWADPVARERHCEALRAAWVKRRAAQTG